MEKIYNPVSIEDKNYKFWIDNKYYKADPTSKKNSFSIVIPPPNVTGSLHIGHALNNTLQDILIRYKKMSGFDVLWMPGTDHAGIATQMVVEREIEKEGLEKNKLGREKFIKRVWDWKDQSGGQIINQLRRLGALLDWDRERFTLDEGLSEAVKKVFVDFYRQGLIYKDKRLVNWDPKLGTAISDLEVDQKEEKGIYWHIRYPIENEAEKFIVVATTRPETMLGDTAVAVHPEDERYIKLIGKNVILPLANRKIPILADEYSDPEKGTGAVKITPAHDFNDFEVANRHNLEMINILDSKAVLNENVPEKYCGLERYEARDEIVKDLEELELIVKVEDTTHTVPYGDRSGVVIEPWLTDQWYVDAKKLSIEAIEAVKSKKIRFYPKYWENTYFEWMNNIEPWCISRQLWWGHQIPAWYGPDGHVFVEYTENEALLAAKQHYGEETQLIRDEDVLDTWFSSGLWPFSTMGWPEETAELEKYYPTSCLITAYDIIFFWVARMIMMGIKLMEDIPFRDIYIHGLIRDEKGQKMSKTKGNVIDPLEVVDKYGADSLRFSLTALASQGRDIKLSIPVIEGYRNFMNKIWNASRFVIMNLDESEQYDSEINYDRLDVPDKWILNKLNNLKKEVVEFYAEYEYDKVALSIYHFIWDEYCDWYIELSKNSLYGDNPDKKIDTQNVLVHVLKESLKLLHPVSPFISEELYQTLKNYNIEGISSESILSERYPEYKDEQCFPTEYKNVEYLKDVIVNIRNLRANLGIHPSDLISVKFKTENSEIRQLINDNLIYLCNLANVKDIEFIKEGEVKKSISSVIQDLEIFLPVEGLIDIEKEVTRLEKDLNKLQDDFNRTSNKLKNEDFLKRAPDDIVEKERNKYEEFTFQINKIEEIISKLKKM